MWDTGDAGHVLDLRAVSKAYTPVRRRSGLLGPIKDLFAPRRGLVHALTDVNLSVNVGEAVGLIGPNGAGKSTLIKMLCGILTPSSGSLSVLGRDPHTARGRNSHQIGVMMGQRTQLWWDLPVRDTFELHRSLYRIPEDAYRQSLDMLTGLLRIDHLLDRLPRSLSLGERVRTDMALAMIHRPRLLFLDEPTIGLDLFAKDAVRTFLSQVHDAGGVTILLTSHDLVDIEAVCERIVIINGGRVTYDSPMNQIGAMLGSARKVTVSSSRDITEIAGPKPVKVGGRWVFTLEAGVGLSDFIGSLEAFDPNAEIDIKRAEIEDFVRAAYGEHHVAGG